MSVSHKDVKEALNNIEDLENESKLVKLKLSVAKTLASRLRDQDPEEFDRIEAERLEASRKRRKKGDDKDDKDDKEE